MLRLSCAYMAVLLCGLVCMAAGNCLAEPSAFDSASPESDTMAMRDVMITSSADGSQQHVMFWAPTQTKEPVPLLVDLHTWSGDYTQPDPRDDFFDAAKERGWAFIHPNFRGPNVRPEACASDLSVADVLDAVEYAKREGVIDDNRIYLVGVSGGGHMALMLACRSPKTWAGVSAWVPISDLAAWHDQNMQDGKRDTYAQHLEQVCGGPPGTSEVVDNEYHYRSPLFYLHQAASLSIDINAGINDGHTGSVPISHSLLAFNVLAEANGFPDQVISDKSILDLVDRRVSARESYLSTKQDEKRKFPILYRRIAGPVRVTIFDGGHQHDTLPAVQWLADQTR